MRHKRKTTKQTMEEMNIYMWIWGIGILCISWSTFKEMRESNETLIIKAVCLVLTMILAPVLAVLQGVWGVK